MYLYNSLTGKKEKFVPLKDDVVSLYVCGITPYDTTHLGHAFVYVFFDVLFRYLRFKGYKVSYTQNVTDINDRDKDLLQRAREQNISWQDLASFWTKRFLDDMKKLGWVMPTNYLKASQNLDSMLALIKRLLDKGYAYEKRGSVYFDIGKKNDFGKLSKLERGQMLKIAKDYEEDIENKDKQDPLDFTLWRAKSKNEPAHTPSFISLYGRGRPGWHIECSAMATRTLGEKIDIHGGGIDLIYPHHEAEIAQSEAATGKTPFVKYWLHVGEVSYQDKKMSKSIGNLVLVSDLLKKYSPNAIRFMLLSHHYRSFWKYREEELKKAEKVWQKIAEENDRNNSEDDLLMNKFEEAMDDDMNTPLALSLLKKSRPSSTKTKLLKILGFN